MDIFTTISLVTGVASIVLAIVAMVTASASEKRSQANFEKTQAMMQDIYDKTKDALAQVDKKAEVIESVVQRNQEQLMNTVTNLLNETVIPKKPDMNEQIGMQLMTGLLQDPSKMAENLQSLEDLTKVLGGFNPSSTF